MENTQDIYARYDLKIICILIFCKITTAGDNELFISFVLRAQIVLSLPQFINYNIDYAFVLHVVHIMIYLNKQQVTHQNIPTGNKMSTGW